MQAQAVSSARHSSHARYAALRQRLCRTLSTGRALSAPGCHLCGKSSIRLQLLSAAPIGKRAAHETSDVTVVRRCGCRDLLERAWTLFLKHGLVGDAAAAWPAVVAPALQACDNTTFQILFCCGFDARLSTRCCGSHQTLLGGNAV